MMMKRVGILSLGLMVAGTMACVDESGEDEPEELGEAGMSLVVDYGGASDVVGMRYNISRVPCAEGVNGFDPIPVVDEDKALSSLSLPGGLSSFNDDPFSQGSAHRFADYFTLIQAGCYDISIRPLKKLGTYKKEGEFSEDCPLEVTRKGVEVEEGKTTEVLLVSQCKGVNDGALDIVAGLNYPPKIVKFEYQPEHVVSCPQGEGLARVKVCATAKDVDGDEMVFYWDQKSGPDIGDDQPELVFSKQVDNKRVECVEYELQASSDGTSAYVFKLSVYDLFVDSYGNKVHAEDWINEEFYEGQEQVSSMDKLKFPVKVSCESDEEPPPTGDTCPRTIGFWGTHHEEWPDGFSPDTILYGTTTWGDVLPPAPENGACGILGRQYVAALLNQAAGAFVPQSIQDALDDAEDLLTDGSLCPGLTTETDPEGQEAVELGEILDAFNNGLYEGDQCVDLEDLNDQEI